MENYKLIKNRKSITITHAITLILGITKINTMRIFFVLFIVGWSGAIQAQTLLPKIGATYARISYEDNEDYKPIVGLTVGVGYNILVSKNLSVQPELNFVQKGSSSTDSYTDFPYGGGFENIKLTTKTRLGYLQVPILVKMNLGKFYFNAGPSIGYGLKGKEEYKLSSSGEDRFGDPISVSHKTKFNVKFGAPPDNYNGDDRFVDNRMNFSVQVGGGVMVMDKVNIDVRYGLGLSNMMDESKSKHRVLQLTLGVPVQL